MTRTAITKSTRPSRYGLLGIYLNDHLAGATAGTELARRMARSHQEREEAALLKRLAAEISQDRSALLDIMTTLGIPVRAYKVGGAWMGEKAGRLKFNGRILSRSPLSDLEELELLRLGVEGKAAGWRTLRTLAGTDARLDADQLDELISRPAARPISSKSSGSTPRAVSLASSDRVPSVAAGDVGVQDGGERAPQRVRH
jgi:hypothetical protein